MTSGPTEITAAEGGLCAWTVTAARSPRIMALSVDVGVVLRLLHRQRQTPGASVGPALGQVRRAGRREERQIIPEFVTQMLAFQKELDPPLFDQMLLDLCRRATQIVRQAGCPVEGRYDVGSPGQVSGVDVRFGNDELCFSPASDGNGTSQRGVLVLGPDRGAAVLPYLTGIHHGYAWIRDSHVNHTPEGLSDREK